MPSDSDDQQSDHSSQPETTTTRAYRAKGPTLGKGKACEACRSRRIRCNGIHPSCANCLQAERECIYLDKPRPPASAAALSAKLAGLEERYRMLSELEAARVGNRTGTKSFAVTESARNWVASLDYPRLPPVRPESAQPQPGALDDPFLEETMTKKERKLMIELYQSQSYRYVVLVTPSNVMARLEDTDHAKRPHPCLLNAMMLVARDLATSFAPEPILDETGARYVDFVMPQSVPSEAALLAKIQAQCTQSLADVDRLTDYIQASLLLALWYLRQGRVLESQYSAAAVSRLVINCRLHQIDGDVMREMAPSSPPLPEGQSRWDDSLLGRPQSREDLAVRISLFWQSFFIDKILRVVSGVPPTYDDDDLCRITTVFPRPRDEYISGVAFDAPFTSIDNLLNGTIFPDNRPDTIGTMNMKAVALLDRSMRYVSQKAAPASEVFHLYQSINMLKDNARRTFSGSPYNRPAAVKSRAFCEATFKCLVQLFLSVAEIHATHAKNLDGSGILFDKDEAFVQRVNAAHECSAILGRALDEIQALGAHIPMDGTRPGIEHTCFAVGLMLMFPTSIIMEKMLKIEAALSNEPEDSALHQDLENARREEELQLETMVETINILRETYPIVEIQWQVLQRGSPPPE